MNKKYVVRLLDKDNSLMSETLLRDHVRHLDRLYKNSVLQTCGPCDDQTALLILTVSSAGEAESVVKADPFVKAGYYKNYEVLEFFEATPENNFLMDNV